MIIVRKVRDKDLFTKLMPMVLIDVKISRIDVNTTVGLKIPFELINIIKSKIYRVEILELLFNLLFHPSFLPGHGPSQSIQDK